jgi:hypothetical protein
MIINNKRIQGFYIYDSDSENIEFTKDDLPEMISIWNEIVEGGQCISTRSITNIKEWFCFFQQSKSCWSCI